VRRELAALGWAVHLLDGRDLTDRGALLDRCAELLRFPAWFKHNFTAFAICLADLSWLPGRGHVVLWDAYGVLADHDPAGWRLAYQVFAEAATGRPTGAPPLYLLLRGAGPVDGLPTL
jgi:hypothetical protein